MLLIQVKGIEQNELELHHLLLDFNGTLAIDGKLIDGVRDKLITIADYLKIHIITGNTFGTAESELIGIVCNLVILENDNQNEQKFAYIERLGMQHVISIGNGSNDQLMLEKSAIGIGVIQAEGISIVSLKCADILCKDINDALSLVLNPKRILSTLRK